MVKQTNASRILEHMNINFDMQEYEVDENDLSAQHVAETLGIPEDSIYKTLVLTGTKEPFLVALMPGDSHLDLKKLAKVSGNKSCEMLQPKNLQKVTGYIRGGCSPIGMKKRFPTYIDDSAMLKEKIIISAGKRGLQISISPKDLQKMTDAVFTDLVK